MSTTIRRDTFKKNILKGLYIARCKQRLTDDYAYDMATNYGETPYMQATFFPSFWKWLDLNPNIKAKYTNNFDNYEDNQIRKQYCEEREKVSTNSICFDDEDIQMASIQKQADDTIMVYIHSNLSYEFKNKQ